MDFLYHCYQLHIYSVQYVCIYFLQFKYSSMTFRSHVQDMKTYFCVKFTKREMKTEMIVNNSNNTLQTHSQQATRT